MFDFVRLRTQCEQQCLIMLTRMLRRRAAPSAFGPFHRRAYRPHWQPCNMRALLFAAFFACAAEAEAEYGQEVSATSTASTCLNLMSYSYVYDDNYVPTGSCAMSFYWHHDPEDDWGLSSPGCYGQAIFGCQSCDGGDPWCQSVDADGEHTGWCYCSDDDAAARAERAREFASTRVEGPELAFSRSVALFGRISLAGVGKTRPFRRRGASPTWSHTSSRASTGRTRERRASRLPNGSKTRTGPSTAARKSIVADARRGRPGDVAPFRTEIRRPGSQVDGAYYCATSWEYSAAEIEDYGFDPGVHRGCIIEDGYSWCEAADASGTCVGWCSCDPSSDEAAEESGLSCASDADCDDGTTCQGLAPSLLDRKRARTRALRFGHFTTDYVGICA